MFIYGSLHAQVCDDPIVDSLADVSYYLLENNPDSAILIGYLALDRAILVGDGKGAVTSFLRIGAGHFDNGEYQKALESYINGEKSFRKYEVDSIYLAKLYLYESPIYKLMGNVDMAIQKDYGAYEISKSMDNSIMMGNALLNMSNNLKDQARFEESLKALHLALTCFPRSYNRELGSIQQNIANIYELQSRHKDAIKLNKEAYEVFEEASLNLSSCKILMSIGNNFLALDDLDSAIYYYNKASVLSNGNYPSLNVKIFHNKGTYFMREGELDSAFVYFEKSLQLKIQSEDTEGSLYTLKNLGDLSVLMNDYEGAESYFLTADSLANTIEDPIILEKTAMELAMIYREKGAYELANLYFDKSLGYQESISNAITAALTYEIEYEKQQRELEQLQMEVKNKELELQKQQGFIWLIVTLSITTSIIFILVYRNSKQRRRNLEMQKKSIEKQKEINDLISKQEKETLRAMFDGQEKEKDRIALELHDKLGAILSTVKLYFKSIDKQIIKLREANIAKYNKANVLLDEACEETRKIAHELSSKNVDRIGLFETVGIFQRRINDSGEITFNLTTHGSDVVLDHLNQVSLYRIIQELVNNILKHALAKEINLQLNVFDDHLFNLLIEDDGVGFEINEIIECTGIGLKEIESRVATMNGKMSIDTGKGVGTSITIDIPLKTKKND